MPLLARGGGSGGGSAGGGSGGGAGGDGGDGGGDGTPQAVSLNDDALVRFDGMDKPVKFGEWKAGYVPKADHEKVSGELTSYKGRVTQAVSNYLESLKAQQANTAKGAAVTDEIDEILGQLEEQPWIDGKTLKAVVAKLKARTGEGSGKLEKGVGLLYQQITTMAKRLQQLEQGRSEESMNSQINRWLKDNDYDPEHYEEFVRDLFAAYEGKPAEIFDLAKKRIDALEAGRESRAKRKKEASAKLPPIPGRGGTPAGGTKPKDLSDKSPEQVADELWEMMKEPEY